MLIVSPPDLKGRIKQSWPVGPQTKSGQAVTLPLPPDQAAVERGSPEAPFFAR